ncbi:MAG: class I SAM-dependent methyltransferase [Proteobacteria bacterium]|nr:class I SAM-dependent methyltransferase [Pseudomonadota bacterium]
MASAPLFYSRPGLNIETYDARMVADAVLFGDDLPFYLAAARRFGGPVLELGAGTGRIALALAEAGFPVVGIDTSPAMRARAEAKRARLAPEVAARARFVAADMAGFALRERGFRLAIAPFRAFQLLASLDSVGASLGSVAGHLGPGGGLAFDLCDPRPERLQAPGEAVELPGVRNPVTGRFVRVLVVGQRLEAGGRRLVERWRFVEDGPDGAALRSEEEEVSFLAIAPPEVRALLAAAGFAVEGEYADFTGTPPDPSRPAHTQVWLARKRAA